MRNSGQAFAVVGTADFSPVASTTVLDKSTRMRHQLHHICASDNHHFGSVSQEQLRLEDFCLNDHTSIKCRVGHEMAKNKCPKGCFSFPMCDICKSILDFNQQPYNHCSICRFYICHTCVATERMKSFCNYFDDGASGENAKFQIPKAFQMRPQLWDVLKRLFSSGSDDDTAPLDSSCTHSMKV